MSVRMSLRQIRVAIARLAPLLALPVAVAAAQSTGPVAPKAPETVVVTGQKDNATIDTVVSQFIDLHAKPNRKTGQYMRDDARPLCPVTVGLPGAFNSFVTKRVLAVAAEVGAKTDPSPSCKANVEILFTDTPAQLIRSLSNRTRGAILGVHFVHEIPRLLEIRHPIQSWYVTGTRYDENSSAPVTTTGPDGSTQAGDGHQTKVDDAYVSEPEQKLLGSNIPMRRVSSLVNVLILADLNRLSGQPIGPVADYIAMLALSQPRSLDACNDLPSILDLTASDCGAREKPQALTASDMAYLKGLYAADLGATTVSVQKENIATGMKSNLDPR